MTHALLSGAAAFAVALLAGRPFVQWIRGQRLGKAISEEGPSTHSIKAGTPTMGGLLIFGAVAIVTIPTNLVERLSILLPLGVVISGMIVGGIDDLGTLTERPAEPGRAELAAEVPLPAAPLGGRCGRALFRP